MLRRDETGGRLAAPIWGAYMAAYGFNNVVETPEPVGYLTQDVGADAELAGDWGVARAGLHYNWFRNNIPGLSFDNPFRAVASIGSGPSSSSTGGPVRGLVALPPDNEAVTGTAAATVKIGGVEEPVRNIMLRLTQLFNVTGHPAITIPCGATTDGLPIGAQLVGRRGGTDDLLSVAESTEALLRPDSHR